jgi:hypothetical protein
MSLLSVTIAGAMSDEKPASLRDHRERAIARLSDLFATDALELDEFEQKLSLVHRAASTAELAQIMGPLPTTGTALAPLPQTALVPASQVSPADTLFSLLGGAVRRGPWTVPRTLRVVSILGGSELDFREARLSPGVTEISVFALMGGVQIVVPPTLAVEVHGTGIMGGFEHMARLPPESDPERPVLRVHGLVIWGGVSIETRLAGESYRDAKHRRRRERKERRRRLRLR